MTKQEFMEKLSSTGSLSLRKEYSSGEIEEKIHKAYPYTFDVSEIVKFFLILGGVVYKRCEKGYDDKLTFELRWLYPVEFWSDINCVVNAVGLVENCSGRIEHFFISEHGKFYNQDHKLIAEDMDGFTEYITTVEYDYHPEITQRTYDMLRFFGWYEGRHIDTTEFEREMNRRGIKLSEKQLEFFAEFSGLIFMFDSDHWYFDTLEIILTKEKYYAEPSNAANEYKTIYCGGTMGGPLAVNPDGIINFFWGLPQGRTTMECINHLCESVSENCKWLAPNRDDET
ncbi:MAG: hypothetical protein HDT43_06480 [Ruminococcaceae bacterium]|nr:hypothetical protein [Oscillospiraceae bacterium]